MHKLVCVCLYMADSGYHSQFAVDIGWTHCFIFCSALVSTFSFFVSEEHVLTSTTTSLMDCTHKGTCQLHGNRHTTSLNSTTRQDGITREIGQVLSTCARYPDKQSWIMWVHDVVEAHAMALNKMGCCLVISLQRRTTSETFDLGGLCQSQWCFCDWWTVWSVADEDPWGRNVSLINPSLLRDCSTTTHFVNSCIHIICTLAEYFRIQRNEYPQIWV